MKARTIITTAQSRKKWLPLISTLKTQQVTEQNSSIEGILTALSKKILSREQVSNILDNPAEFPVELIKDLSVATALKYWNGQIDYGDGDCIMNNLFMFWTTNQYYFENYAFTDIAWECYDAFDSGEYYRENDDRSVDPSEKYTRPLIEILLRKRKLIF